MEIKKAVMVLAAGLLLVAIALCSPLPWTAETVVGGAANQDKIDPSLELKMNGATSKLPVIVLFENEKQPDLGEIEIRYSYRLLNGVAGTASSAAIRRLAAQQSVSSIYLDGSVRVAKPFDMGSGIGEISPSKVVNAQDLWSRGIDGSGVVVAVIDSGIDKNHPDLAGKVVGEKNFVQGDETADDLLGHGTLCAGIIAGSGAASGGRYRGIAPGASLLNVRVIDREGNGQVSDIIAGMEWAMENGADVLSLSLAGLNLGETNPPVTMAADNAMDTGAVVCVAAGNNG